MGGGRGGGRGGEREGGREGGRGSTYFGQRCQTLLFHIPDELLAMEVEDFLDVQFGYEDTNRHSIGIHLGVDLGRVDATDATGILPFHHSSFIPFKSANKTKKNIHQSFNQCNVFDQSKCYTMKLELFETFMTAPLKEVFRPQS